MIKSSNICVPLIFLPFLHSQNKIELLTLSDPQLKAIVEHHSIMKNINSLLEGYSTDSPIFWSVQILALGGSEVWEGGQ